MKTNIDYLVSVINYKSNSMPFDPRYSISGIRDIFISEVYKHAMIYGEFPKAGIWSELYLSLISSAYNIPLEPLLQLERALTMRYLPSCPEIPDKPSIMFGIILYDDKGDSICFRLFENVETSVFKMDPNVTHKLEETVDFSEELFNLNREIFKSKRIV